MAAKNFRVAIVGGGVCGVVCAIGLQRAGIYVDIFEAASKYGEVGAGIGIGPNAILVLRKLGLINDITSFSEEEDPPAVRPFTFRFPPSDAQAVLFQSPAGEDDLTLGMHRASFLDALVKSIDPEFTSTHFNKRCTSITESSGARSSATLHFSDGTTHETDLVLGADGVKSTVRNFVAGEEASKSLIFTNGVAYRGLVSMEKVEEVGVKIEEDVYTIWMGDGVHLVTYPIRNKTILNVAAFVTDFSVPMGYKPLPPGEPWVIPTSREEVLGHFKGWNRDAVKIIESIEQPTKWYVHGLYPPLESFVKGRVALIGDAAHAMLPFLAAGVGQGIEDAYVMSRLLAHPQANASNLENVLKAYDRVRTPRANDISLRSKRCGDIYEGYGPSGPSARGRLADMKVLEPLLDLLFAIDMSLNKFMVQCAATFSPRQISVPSSDRRYLRTITLPPEMIGAFVWARSHSDDLDFEEDWRDWEFLPFDLRPTNGTQYEKLLELIHELVDWSALQESAVDELTPLVPDDPASRHELQQQIVGMLNIVAQDLNAAWPVGKDYSKAQVHCLLIERYCVYYARKIELKTLLRVRAAQHRHRQQLRRRH
ncbi:hypothetical protein EVG20_g9106 [Dentipellis fragilis]|uniref:FAD-binding domain-containing protein n=1 Tax=Dentipellis fragilis TaxID=205917 RepID=A0A4Y9Y2K9_9AGAM|nr:hypothetical protein EVG20_g9106 [Dentipellis fragilis]